MTRPVPTESSHLLILHKLLEAVDPKEAGRWHWRDGRKVRRGLERWWERGGVDVQAKGDTPEGSGRRAKFRSLIFWVYEPLEALQPRLDRRVDRMVEVRSASDSTKDCIEWSATRNCRTSRDCRAYLR